MPGATGRCMALIGTEHLVRLAAHGIGRKPSLGSVSWLLPHGLVRSMAPGDTHVEMTETEPKNAEERKPARVFLSYSREDHARAESIVTVLEQAGFEVWWDGLLVGGTAFANVIEEALEAAVVVVVLWSRASIPSDWVRDEAARGRDRGCLVPVSLDGSEPPLGFRQYHVIDLSKWRGKAEDADVRALVNSVRAAQGVPPTVQRPLTLLPGRHVSRRRILIAGGGLAFAALGGGWLAWRRGLVGGPGVASNSVAVLPFVNLSGDPGQGYFSDGLAAEVRAELARNSGLQVIGQVSSDTFRDSKLGAVGIAQGLGVAYLLDGNVRRSGTNCRINAELLDGRSGFSHWAQSFDRSIEDIFAVQSEIAGSVVAALTREMKGANAGAKEPSRPKLGSGGTTNVAAFDAYLRGRAAFNQYEGEASDRAALAAFDAAIAADPKFAAAHAARSRSLIVIANQYADAAHTTALYDAGIEAARTAIALAPEFADAQSALAFALFQGRLDVRGARAPYDLSRQLGPGDATVMGRFALYCAATGRAAEAYPAMQRAQQLDPLNPLVHRAMGSVLYAARRYAEMLPQVRRALTINPKLSGAHAAIGSALLLLGRARAAREAYLEEPQSLARLTGLAIVERQLHNDSAAHDAMNALVNELGDSALYQRAEVHAQWGERDIAMSILARARAIGDSGLIYTRTDPFLDPLRALPQFIELLRQLGFD